jgi:hypothetical protein
MTVEVLQLHKIKEINLMQPDTLTRGNVAKVFNNLLCKIAETAPGMVEGRWVLPIEGQENNVNWIYYPNWRFTREEDLEPQIIAITSTDIVRYVIEGIAVKLLLQLDSGHGYRSVLLGEKHVGCEIFLSNSALGGYWIRIITSV